MKRFLAYAVENDCILKYRCLAHCCFLLHSPAAADTSPCRESSVSPRCVMPGSISFPCLIVHPRQGGSFPSLNVIII